jgi:hypothetical protein
MACGINPYLDGKFGTGFQIGHLLDVWSCAWWIMWQNLLNNIAHMYLLSS